MVKQAKQPYPIQVRPSPEVREALRAAADAAGRTLNREMERRLEASVRGEFAPTALYPGWPAEDQQRFQALANVVGILCARATLTIGAGASRTYILGAVKAVLSEVFGRLGADAIKGQDEKFFAMLAQQVVGEMRHAGTMKVPAGDRALFAELLAFADFVKAWGVQGKASP
jgi:hypothetical protein